MTTLSIQLLKSVKSNPPKYSEIFFDTPFGLGVARLVVNNYDYFIYTSKATEIAMIEQLVTGRQELSRGHPGDGQTEASRMRYKMAVMLVITLPVSPIPSMRPSGNWRLRAETYPIIEPDMLEELQAEGEHGSIPGRDAEHQSGRTNPPIFTSFPEQQRIESLPSI